MTLATNTSKKGREGGEEEKKVGGLGRNLATAEKEGRKQLEAHPTT